MTAQCPTTGRMGPCPWLELQASRRARLTGWTSAAAGVAVMAGSLGLLASLAAPAPQPFAVELLPAPQSAIAALPEPAPPPDIALLAPPEDRPETLTEAPKLAEAAEEPEAPALPPTLPQATAPAADSLPQPAPPPPEPARKPVEKVAEKPAEKPAESPVQKPKEKAAKKPKSEHPQAAPQVTTAQAGQAASPREVKAWAAAVVKQIRRTKRMGSGARGTVQVGFTVGKDGSLAAVKVIASSGDAALDAMGLDHIRRAAPFPVPPEGATRNLAFAFEIR